MHKALCFSVCVKLVQLLKMLIACSVCSQYTFENLARTYDEFVYFASWN